MAVEKFIGRLQFLLDEITGIKLRLAADNDFIILKPVARIVEAHVSFVAGGVRLEVQRTTMLRAQTGDGEEVVELLGRVITRCKVVSADQEANRFRLALPA